MHIVIKGTKTIQEYKELYNAMEILAWKCFETHSTIFEDWQEGAINKVWLDDNRDLCIEYESGNWGITR